MNLYISQPYLGAHSHTIETNKHAEVPPSLNANAAPQDTSRLGGKFTFLPIHILAVGPLVYEYVNKLCTPY